MAITGCRGRTSRTLLHELPQRSASRRQRSSATADGPMIEKHIRSGPANSVQAATASGSAFTGTRLAPAWQSERELAVPLVGRPGSRDSTPPPRRPGSGSRRTRSRSAAGPAAAAPPADRRGPGLERARRRRRWTTTGGGGRSRQITLVVAVGARHARPLAHADGGCALGGRHLLGQPHGLLDQGLDDVGLLHRLDHLTADEDLTLAVAGRDPEVGLLPGPRPDR